MLGSVAPKESPCIVRGPLTKERPRTFKFLPQLSTKLEGGRGLSRLVLRMFLITTLYMLCFFSVKSSAGKTPSCFIYLTLFKHSFFSKQRQNTKYSGVSWSVASHLRFRLLTLEPMRQRGKRQNADYLISFCHTWGFQGNSQSGKQPVRYKMSARARTTDTCRYTHCCQLLIFLEAIKTRFGSIIHM